MNRRILFSCCKRRLQVAEGQSTLQDRLRELAAAHKSRVGSTGSMARSDVSTVHESKKSCGCCHHHLWARMTADKYLFWPNGQDSSAWAHPLHDEDVLRIFNFDYYVQSGRLTDDVRTRIMRLRAHTRERMGIVDYPDEQDTFVVNVYELSQLIRRFLAKTQGMVLDQLATDLADRGLTWSDLFRSIATRQEIDLVGGPTKQNTGSLSFMSAVKPNVDGNRLGLASKRTLQISPKELFQYLKKYAVHHNLGSEQHVTKGDIDALFEKADTDGDGFLDLQEFLEPINYLQIYCL